MNKEQFYRKDFETFKPKYFLCCLNCKVENGVIVKKYSETFGNVKNK
jgi:hypothetical protein